MIKNIIEVFKTIVDFALKSLESYIDPELENICYLTIFQNPMIRGIKSAPFNLKDDINKGTANLLSKLNRFLVLNSELKINESFILYANILSLTSKQLMSRKKKMRFAKVFFT